MSRSRRRDLGEGGVAGSSRERRVGSRGARMAGAERMTRVLPQPVIRSKRNSTAPGNSASTSRVLAGSTGRRSGRTFSGCLTSSISRLLPCAASTPGRTGSPCSARTRRGRSGRSSRTCWAVDKSAAAEKPDPTRIPMGGVDKCLICGWQGRPDEAHGCPRYRTPEPAATLDDRRPPCRCEPWAQRWKADSPERCANCGGTLLGVPSPG